MKNHINGQQQQQYPVPLLHWWRALIRHVLCQTDSSQILTRRHFHILCLFQVRFTAEASSFRHHHFTWNPKRVSGLTIFFSNQSSHMGPLSRCLYTHDSCVRGNMLVSWLQCIPLPPNFPAEPTNPDTRSRTYPWQNTECLSGLYCDVSDSDCGMTRNWLNFQRRNRMEIIRRLGEAINGIRREKGRQHGHNDQHQNQSERKTWLLLKMTRDIIDNLEMLNVSTGFLPPIPYDSVDIADFVYASAVEGNRHRKTCWTPPPP